MPAGLFPVIKGSRFSEAFGNYIRAIYHSCSQMGQRYKQIRQGLLLTISAPLSKNEHILKSSSSQKQMFVYRIKSQLHL